MFNQSLNVKRAHSENFSLRPTIISPCPVRAKPKLSSHLAREVFDSSTSLEDLDSNTMNDSFPIFTRPKFYSLRLDSISPKSIWEPSSSESSNSNHDSPKSPMKDCERNYLLTDISEEISLDIPRSSNPIVHDINFMRNNLDSLKMSFGNEGAISRS